MATVLRSSTFAAAPAGSSQTDSLTYGNGALWVEYGNHADPLGATGNSTIVQYSLTGAVLNTYTLSGHVDGLKYDEQTNVVWGLHNEDGNVSTTLINATTGVVSAPLFYATADVNGTGATQGIDDIAFDGTKTYVSETIPANSGDTVIALLTNGQSPFGTLTKTPILAFGATGTNLLTGQVQTLPLNDPDSLKVLANGGLLLSSGDDGSLIFVNNPGTAQQTQSFINIPGTTAGGVGLDDAVIPTTANGTLYIADSTSNNVTQVAISGATTNDIFVSVGSLKEVADVNLQTGTVTTLVGNLDSPHGLVFIGSDGTVANNSPVTAGSGISATDLSEVTGLYQAALNRAPDQVGLQFWKGLLDTGAATFAQVAASFTSSSEFMAGAGAMTNAQFVTQEYQNALGRGSDTAGAAFWNQQLAGGASRASIVMGFSTSQEGLAVLAPATAAARSLLA